VDEGVVDDLQWQEDGSADGANVMQGIFKDVLPSLNVSLPSSIAELTSSGASSEAVAVVDASAALPKLANEPSHADSIAEDDMGTVWPHWAGASRPSSLAQAVGTSQARVTEREHMHVETGMTAQIQLKLDHALSMMPRHRRARPEERIGEAEMVSRRIPKKPEKMSGGVWDTYNSAMTWAKENGLTRDSGGKVVVSIIAAFDPQNPFLKLVYLLYPYPENIHDEDDYPYLPHLGIIDYYTLSPDLS